MNGNDPLNAGIFDPSVLDSLYEAVGNDIKHIIFIYIEDFPKMIAEMKLALANNDLETIGRLAHSLKSSSGNLGANELVSIARSIESYIIEKNSIDTTISAEIINLETAFNRIKPELTAYLR